MIGTVRTAALGLILVVACGPAPAGRPEVSPTTPPSPTASPAASASPTPVPTNDPRAQGATSVSLASRTSPDPLYERPYVGAYELPNQPPGGTLDHGALPSIWYVTKGTVRWTTTSGTVIDVGTGEAAATPTLGFVESNPGTTSNSAYGFLVYATQSRLLLSNQVQREIVASPMLPVPQPAGLYTLRLELVTLQAAGRTAAASHAGAAVQEGLDRRPAPAARRRCDWRFGQGDGLAAAQCACRADWPAQGGEGARPRQGRRRGHALSSCRRVT